MKGAIFNLLYGRPFEHVADEIDRLFAKHRLDFMLTQETAGYLDDLRGDAQLQVFPAAQRSENAILVRPGLRADRARLKQYGDGWTTVRGGHHPPVQHATVRLDGRLRVRCLHQPTPSEWRAGALWAPLDRADDLKASAAGAVRYLNGLGPRLVGGDWNEPITTVGKWSPRWVAAQTKAQWHVPTSAEGHGRIDYLLAKRCHVVDVFKDTEIREASDHEPVIFRVLL